MFYGGDLQSGIASALQKDIPVVCFVRDDSALSKEWEDEWLAPNNVAEALSEQSVPLRLEAGSQEASFLSAFCSLDSTPTIIIVKRGQLIERLSSDILRNDFTTRLLAAIQSNGTASMDSDEQRADGDPEMLPTAPATSADATLLPDGGPRSANSVDAPGDSQSASQVQALLQERRHKLEADRKRKEEAEKAERIAKQKVQREEQARRENETGSSKSSGKLTYQQEQVKKKREARDERARILRIIENDKIERKEREERRRALARADADAEREAQLTEAESDGVPVFSAQTGSNCSIQVRLLNGSTIRANFPGKNTVAVDVRKWIDENRTDGSTPYVLKQVMLPNPSRTLSEEEESKSLHSLNLIPSATLILIPTNGVVSSYADAMGHSGFFSRTIDTIYGLLVAMIGSITGLIQYFLGIRTATDNPPASSRVNSQPAPDQEPPVMLDDAQGDATTSATATGPKIRIRTLRSQADEQEKRLPELYNGNQLSFEPRTNEKEDEKQS